VAVVIFIAVFLLAVARPEVAVSKVYLQHAVVAAQIQRFTDNAAGSGTRTTLLHNSRRVSGS
jgi:hypothetical protein